MKVSNGFEILNIKDVEKISKRVDEVTVGEQIFFIGQWHTVTETRKFEKARSRSTRLFLGNAPFRFANSTKVYVKVGA